MSRRGRFGRTPRPLRRVWRAWTRLVKLISTALFGTLLLAFGLLFFNYVVVATPQDRAYRNLDPERAGLRGGARARLDRSSRTSGLSALAAGAAMEGDGWHDLTNDETAAVRRRRVLRDQAALRDPAPHHPGTSAGRRGDRLHARLPRVQGERRALRAGRRRGRTRHGHRFGDAEARDGGRDARRRDDDGAGASGDHQLDALQQRLRVRARITSSCSSTAGATTPRSATRTWRTRASTPRMPRASSPSAAQALGRDCATKVTAIYVGWRGARVDERWLKQTFGERFGGALASLSAGSTLFDRKPVAETIAPSAVSALALDRRGAGRGRIRQQDDRHRPQPRRRHARHRAQG